MIKHTPTPWVAVGFYVENINDNEPDICTCEPGAMGQASLALECKGKDPWGKIAIANAEFIARACNAHDELVAAAKALINGPAEGRVSPSEPDSFEKNVSRLEAAIAKAEGK